MVPSCFTTVAKSAVLMMLRYLTAVSTAVFYTVLCAWSSGYEVGHTDASAVFFCCILCRILLCSAVLVCISEQSERPSWFFHVSS